MRMFEIFNQRKQKKNQSEKRNKLRQIALQLGFRVKRRCKRSQWLWQTSQSQLPISISASRTSAPRLSSVQDGNQRKSSVWLSIGPFWLANTTEHKAEQRKPEAEWRRWAERSRLQGMRRGMRSEGGGWRKKSHLWMTHPLRRPFRCDASKLGYLKQAQTAVLPSNMITSRAGRGLRDSVTSGHLSEFSSPVHRIKRVYRMEHVRVISVCFHGF